MELIIHIFRLLCMTKLGLSNDLRKWWRIKKITLSIRNKKIRKHLTRVVMLNRVEFGKSVLR